MGSPREPLEGRRGSPLRGDPPPPRKSPRKVKDMDYPEDLLYTKEHTWVRQASDIATVGISDYAQEALGDVVYVQIPRVGEVAAASATIAVVESLKAVSDICAPVSGLVEEANQNLVENPEKINSDPYGEGWLLKIRQSPGHQPAGLMPVSDYRAYVEEETSS